MLGRPACVAPGRSCAQRARERTATAGRWWLSAISSLSLCARVHVQPKSCVQSTWPRSRPRRHGVVSPFDFLLSNHCRRSGGNYHCPVTSTVSDTLLELARRDLATRERLASDGSLFNGYHPEMQQVHEENAAVLDTIISEHGWPTTAAVGREAAEAAWLIAQHAIGLPAFQRRCLSLLQAAATGDVPAWHPAMLLDRICVFEGRPQVFGTSFDWDEAGEMSPLPIDNAAEVDARRASVGLPPLASAIERHRRRSRA